MTTIKGRVFDGFGNQIGSGLVLDGNQLAEVIPGTPDANWPLIVPGFVDVHCHGGGGFSFPDTTNPEEIATAIKAHRSGGTTALFASLVSLADPLPYIKALIPFCEKGELAGLHLEGPFISKAKCGAQNPEVIRPADLTELETWLHAGQGWFKTMTIAPETDNALAAAKLLLKYGAVPSWGHTSCDEDQARLALDYTVKTARELNWQGYAQTVTHLFNAMSPINHRSPGPIIEFLRSAKDRTAGVEVIADGHHLKPELVEDMFSTFPDASLFFVTDALAAACMPPGKYTLGGLKVEVKNGACYLDGTNTLSGGASCLLNQFALFARRGQIPLAKLIRACVGTPVQAASIPEDVPGVTTRFTPGCKPSFMLLDSDYRIQRLFRQGEEIEPSTTES